MHHHTVVRQYRLFDAECDLTGRVCEFHGIAENVNDHLLKFQIVSNIVFVQRTFLFADEVETFVFALSVGYDADLIEKIPEIKRFFL